MNGREFLKRMSCLSPKRSSAKVRVFVCSKNLDCYFFPPFINELSNMLHLYQPWNLKCGCFPALTNSCNAQELKSTKAKVVGLPDSGFFYEYEGVGQYISGIKMLFEQQNSSDGLNQGCITSHKKSDGQMWKCMFAQESSKFIKTRAFAMQSRFDGWQLTHEIKTSDVAAVNKYGEAVSNVFLQDFLGNSGHGAFLGNLLSFSFLLLSNFLFVVFRFMWTSLRCMEFDYGLCSSCFFSFLYVFWFHR